MVELGSLGAWELGMRHPKAHLFRFELPVCFSSQPNLWIAPALLALLSPVQPGAEPTPSLNTSPPAPRSGAANPSLHISSPSRHLASTPQNTYTSANICQTATPPVLLPSWPAMFRDFSFNPASPPAFHAYEADRAAMNVSPTSQPAPGHHYLNRPPTPPCTIGDLASQLNQQSLRIDTSIKSDAASSSSPITPPSYADPIEPLQQSEARPTFSRVSASLLRMQRQSTSRMQCNPSHVRDISRLVQMLQEEEQCTVNDASSQRLLSMSSTSASDSSTSCPAVSEGDEGVDMDYDIPSQNMEALLGTPQWRCTERRDSRIRVTKPVRMRKRSGDKVEKRRSK